MIDLPGLAEVWDALPEARVVGGAVRDMLTERKIADVDFSSPLLPEAVMQRLQDAGIKAVPTGLAHGTVTAVSQGSSFEVTTLRRDVATDGRRAVVAFTDDWHADASRRDFTFNAMSVDRHGAIYDYFGGRGDLAAGRVRFVGVASRRIEEDYLRILRYFRFLAGFGTGEPDEEAAAAVSEHRAGVQTLSAERVWMEIKRLLGADDPRRSLALMQKAGVLPLVLPDAKLMALDRLVSYGAPADALLRLAALLDGDAGKFYSRFKLSNSEQTRLLSFEKFASLRPELEDADLRRALAQEEASVIVDRTWLAGNGTAAWQALRGRINRMERPVFPLLGRDITLLGVPPGPQVGGILEEVRQWWLRGGCVADAAACRAKAAALVARPD